MDADRVNPYLSIDSPSVDSYTVSETAQLLLDAAERRIRDAGYNGFSFRDLARDVGITSASVHHHFPTKAALAATVAARYGDRFIAALQARGEDEVVAACRDLFRASLAADGRMCLCGILGAEAGGLPKEVAAEARRFFTRCVDYLAQRLKPASTATAMQVIATLEGAMILARAFDDIATFDQATAMLDSA